MRKATERGNRFSQPQLGSAGDALQLLPFLATCGPSRLLLPLFEAGWKDAQPISLSNTDDDDTIQLTPWHVSHLLPLMQADADTWDSFRLIEAMSLLKAFSQGWRPSSSRSSAIQDRKNSVPKSGEKRMIDLTQSNDEAETGRTMSPKRVKSTSKATSTGELVLLSNDREVIDLDAVEGHGVVNISDDDEEVRNVNAEQVELAGVLGTLIKYRDYYAPKKNNVRST